MRGLSLTILVLLLYFNIIPQEKNSDSPHGENFNVSCDECHNSESWKINMATFSFDHNTKTNFALEGLHNEVDCKSCHDNLKFSPTESACASCHTDIHEQTVGFECERCHTSNSWMVENMTQIHQLSRFPLLGAHNTADCYDCHTTASTLRFDPLDTDCFSCHQADYNATTSPNHAQSNYSTECTDCHQMNAFGWTGSDINHSFFPLREGHDIADCSQCHQDPNDYGNISADCISCHQNDYNSASSPDHAGSGFSTDCSICHSLAPGWKPADFSQHDLVFPIYSGEHNGEWNSCTDCHQVPNNYSIFTCISCHEHNQSEMNEEHNGIGGYIYDSQACLECHPTGSEEGTFDHNKSAFPLTGAHTDTDCASCHTNGYANTPNNCDACHITEYNNTTAPNHGVSDFSVSCDECHTTNAGWKPADFSSHDNLFFPIYSGEHNGEWNECIECHNVDGNYQIFTCVECHDHNQPDTDEEHNGIGGYIYESNACFECHPTGSGEGTFDHNQSNFPLTGAHTDTDCASCHENGYSGTPTVCAECHITDYNNTTSPNHVNIDLSTNCEECHSTEPGWSPADFTVHDNLFFPIYSGEHNGEWNLCLECHNVEGNYQIFTCIDCHDHNQTEMNDEHNGIPGYIWESNACFECHPTGSEEGAFNHNESNFPLTGAHNGTTCSSCHENGYQGTPTDCLSCHTSNYNETSNPNHLGLNLSTTCEDCHTSDPGWEPATFDVHNDYYPLNGAHNIIANECANCHNGDYNNTANTCYACHTNEYNQTTDPPHQTAQFSTDCILCHTESAWDPSTFNHDAQYFPIYSGKHNGEWNNCSECHTNPNNYADFSCIDCHEHNQAEMNSEHSGVSGYSWNSNACFECHPNGSEDMRIHNINNIR